jgi:imidazole glycerol-phosphate synthase subunit HisF
MLRPRVIPCLLVRDKGLVKTVGFGDGKYVGDPINAVRIFNEKSVDELIVLDIDATSRGTEPDYALIETLASECRMPLCYGGGIRTEEQGQRIIRLGVEKVALSSAAIEDPGLVSRLATLIGSQSVVVVLDVKKQGGRYEVFTHNGKRKTGRDPVELARLMERAGAGEIVVNSIDNDGAMKGYDLALTDSMRDATTLPMTVLGGAGSLKDIGDLVARYGIIGAAAGSLFVFKGIYRAVLINYPKPADKLALMPKELAS